MIAKPTWVDPAEGWRFGFPKLWDGEEELHEWLLAEGCPLSHLEFPIRMWYSEENNDTADS